MIIGSIVPGGSTISLAADSVVLVAAVDLPETEYLVRVGAYLDGGGASNADQVVRGVLYTDAGVLVAAGDAVTIFDDQPAGWVWLAFPGLDGLELPAAGYRFGLHAGVTGAGARLHVGGTGSRTVFTGHTFTDGPPESLTGGSTTATAASLLLEVIDQVRLPDAGTVDDDYLATLPWDVTQRVFGASAAIRGTLRTATAGWYGTKFDPTMGAVAIVRSDGPLADLVGERVQVTRRAGAPRSVVVYITDERDFPDELADEDLLLTRRGFFALADLATDALDVTVEVLA